MKDFYRKIILFHLIILYGFIILFYSNNSLSFTTRAENKGEQEKQSCFHLTSPDLFHHTLPSEKIAGTKLPSLALNTKETFGFSSTVISKTFEFHYQTNIRTYFFLNANIHPGLSIPDIIFPFHDFI